MIANQSNFKSTVKRLAKIIFRCLKEQRRPSWVEFGLILANCCALRSEDPNTKVGCVAFRNDNSIVSLGYNGTPSGVNINWSNRDEKLKRVSHAELSCLRYAVPGEVKYLCLTHHPCVNCVTLIRSYNIKELFYQIDYHRDTSNEAAKIAEEFGIKITKIS